MLGLIVHEETIRTDICQKQKIHVTGINLVFMAGKRNMVTSDDLQTAACSQRGLSVITVRN